MNKRIKEKYYKELLLELEEIKIKERSNDYLIDYLYGISNIKEELEKKLSEISNNEWILFYRLLVNRFVLEDKIELISRKKNTYFIMENENDLEYFFEYLDNQDLDLKEECNNIFSTYSEDEIEKEYKEKLKPLLLNFLKAQENKNSSTYSEALYKFGEELKTLNSKKKVNIKQSDFLMKEFNFKKDDYSKLVKQYKENRR